MSFYLDYLLFVLLLNLVSYNSIENHVIIACYFLSRIKAVIRCNADEKTCTRNKVSWDCN